MENTTSTTSITELVEKLESLSADQVVGFAKEVVEQEKNKMLFDLVSSVQEPVRITKTGKVTNYYYLSEGYCFIYIVSKVRDGFVIVDEATYNELLDTDTCSLTFSYKDETSYDVRVLVNGELKDGRKVSNIFIHQLIAGWKKGMCVDHMTHNKCINLNRFLRVCSSQENTWNRAKYSLIRCESGKWHFKAVYKDSFEQYASLSYLAQLGVSLTRQGNYVTSQGYNTFGEVVKAIEVYETAIQRQFRYNPLVDMKDTWYIFVLNAFLDANIDIEEYNRDFFRKYRAEIAQYYGVA